MAGRARMTISPDPASPPAARPWRDALLASVVENLPCGLSVFDAQLRLVAWNRHWQQLLDLPENLLHRPDAGFEDFARFLALRGDYGREPTEETVQALVAEARQPRLQLLHLTRPGVTLEVRRSPLPGGGFITTYVDISAQRAAEEEIRKAKEAAEEANRAKGEFLDNVSHEIRTPLNGVLGLTRLLLAENLSPQQRRYAELADASATSLLRLIDDLLDLGRIESGRLELEAHPFDLRGLLEQLAELYRIRAEAKGLRFQLDVDAAVPAAVIGDAGR
jgi:signal transduction histidine kinase